MNPPRINVFGTHFSETNLDEVIDILRQYDYKQKSYICFPSTNIVSKAYWDKDFQSILNGAYLTIPDGKITEVYCRIKGSHKIRTTSGFNILKALLETSLTHYFYGATPEILELINNRIQAEFPKAKVLGYRSPPFLEKSEIPNNPTINADIEAIKTLGPDIIWIGISNIKQDYLMYHYLPRLDKGIMLGVGAVFLYFAGVVDPGPDWLKRLGLRWVYRVMQEPRKEFKKTVPSTLFFIILVLWEVLSYPIRLLKRK